MFIIIPLTLIGISILTIAVIVWRKMPYLRKLAPEAHTFDSTIAHDFFPELMGAVEGIEFKKYLSLWLNEVEKLIRKVRILFSRVDRMSDSLIKRIRSIHANRMARQQEATTAEPAPVEAQTPEYVDVPTVQVRPRRIAPDPVALKAEEQRLIVAIAHDPKNPALYRDLGDVYVKMKNLEDAKESFTAALKLNQNDEVTMRKLAQVMQKLEPEVFSPVKADPSEIEK
jgi:tetratricopeptide (TPR) repeat protein